MAKIDLKTIVLWRQVLALAGVQGAITVLWVIYNIYIVQLLTTAGLPEGWARGLLIVENALGVVMEPLMGGLSDRAQRFLGSRFPFIAVGVILSSALFMAIPAVLIFGTTTIALQWLLVVVIILWALAMTMFRSPALCLLGQYAFGTQLPQAASILTLVGGLAGSLRPFVSGFLLSLGPAITFTIGSFTLLGAAAVLRANHPPTFQPVASEPVRGYQWRISMGSLVVVGFAVAWAVRLLMGELLPRMIQLYFPGTNVAIVLGGFSIALAIASVPAGIWATRGSNRWMMTLGALGAGVAVALFAIPMSLLGAISTLLLLICLSFVLNGALPLALSVAPSRWGGLSIGLYFGGFSAAMSLFGYLFPQPNQLSLTAVVGMGSLMFGLAGLSIALFGQSYVASVQKN